MCGIVGGVGQIDGAAIKKLAHRGPDASAAWQGDGFWLGHTRLSIIDVGSRSNQPFVYGDVVLVFNGELWNFEELRERLQLLGAEFRTKGDTEVVAAALHHWGADALQRFEGMFAIAWTDDGGASVKLARDRFGEVPLHYSHRAKFFASELKAFPKGAIGQWVEPGTIVDVQTGVSCSWYELSAWHPSEPPHEAIRAGIEHGAREREISDVGYCLLLSGGIDSSAIAYHVGKKGTVAYTAVGSGKAIEERAAREVAEQIGLDLRLVRVPDPTADDLARVVHTIEMPHKAQVEIAWACHHLGLAMKRDGFRVTFSGEGSDELWASYGISAHHGIQKDGWHGYRRKLFHEQHRKNFARCNKIFMANSVECRLPFLSTRLVETALALDEKDVRDPNCKSKSDRDPGRKAVLRRAYEGLLPRSVLDRQKMTFQDGAGLQAACARAVADPQRFYKAEFETRYPGAKP